MSQSGSGGTQPSDCRGSASGLLSAHDTMTNLSMCNMFSTGSTGGSHPAAANLIHNYSSHHFGSNASDLLAYKQNDLNGQRQLSGGMCS